MCIKGSVSAGGMMTVVLLLLASCGVLLVTHLPTAHGGLTKHCPPGFKPHAGGTACGSELTTIITLICRGNVNSNLNFNKRSNQYSHSWNPSGPFIGQAEAHSYFQKRDYEVAPKRAFTQGITCECCKHQCDITEMMEYCGNDEKKRSGPPPVDMLSWMVPTTTGKTAKGHHNNDNHKTSDARVASGSAANSNADVASPAAAAAAAAADGADAAVPRMQYPSADDIFEHDKDVILEDIIQLERDVVAQEARKEQRQQYQDFAFNDLD